jgi:hypothetical protein
LALIAPCGGWSGLPKEAACAAPATAPAADTASKLRLENMIVAPLKDRMQIKDSFTNIVNH